MRRPWFMFVIIIIIAMIAVAIDRPHGQISFYNWHKAFNFSQGLDLQGGIELQYTMDLSKVTASEQSQAISGVKNVIENRINPLGIAEPVVQTTRIGNSAGLIVELPGQKDFSKARDLIGQTAKLTFQEEKADSSGFQETGLTGADLKTNGASVSLNPTTNQPEINLVFNSEGAQKFAAITGRNVGKPLAIYLDTTALQIATVQEQISGGQAQITGSFTLAEAQQTVRLINAGALPVPLNLVQQQTIGATLGQESVQRSLIAGLVGLLGVGLFMIIYYRLLGLVSVIALILYTLISLAIFKAMPVTLTLAGITGFILSIGMAVDANILIFERFKEERREGKPINLAIEQGFARAWSSIRDSNVSSILTALILYNFGSSSLIKGFALTLIIGILASLFTAITVSRTLLYLFMSTRMMPSAVAPELAPIKAPWPKAERRGRW